MRPADARRLVQFRWIAAFALVTATHAAALSVAMRSAESLRDEDTSGAFLVELAPLVTAAREQPEELTPAPPSAASAEAEAVAPSAAEKEQVREPEAAPLAEAAVVPPELILPKPVEQPLEMPKEETDEPKQQRPTPAQAASVASISAAPPKIEEAVVADRSTAPAAGVSERDRRVLAQWHGAMSAHLVRHARFPSGFRDLDREHEARVRFKVDRRGNVLAVEIVKSSGSDTLDAAAEATVRRASPMPTPPDNATEGALDLEVPVRFKRRR